MDKSNFEDLAYFGGTPSFAAPLHVGRPNIGDRERLFTRINDILDRRWLTNGGPLVQEFEQRIADFLGVQHCITMCNATVGLEIAIRALELTGEVIIPSFTFIATAHSLQWQEITPVFCDVDSATHNLDPAKVEALITPRTTGIIGVHVWGRPCSIEALSEIAQRHHLRLMFDAAHAFGCSHNTRVIGNFGEAEVFSFHATKFFNTFEGGAVTTNDDDLAAKMRLMKNFGFAGYDNVIYVGTNGKMSEVSAAMGLTNLEAIDEFVAVNYRNYKQYQKELDGLKGVHFVTYDEAEKNNYQYLVLEIDDGATGISRDQLVKLLYAENILARRYFYPGCHRMQPYLSLFPDAGLHLPETERITERIVCLPTGTGVNTKQIGIVCQIIRFVLENGADVAARLEKKAG